jgi:hypothetical protein
MPPYASFRLISLLSPFSSVVGNCTARQAAVESAESCRGQRGRVSSGVRLQGRAVTEVPSRHACQAAKVGGARLQQQPQQ